jgi:hypothetical protein
VNVNKRRGSAELSGVHNLSKWATPQLKGATPQLKANLKKRCGEAGGKVGRRDASWRVHRSGPRPTQPSTSLHNQLPHTPATMLWVASTLPNPQLPYTTNCPTLPRLCCGLPLPYPTLKFPTKLTAPHSRDYGVVCPYPTHSSNSLHNQLPVVTEWTSQVVHAHRGGHVDRATRGCSPPCHRGSHGPLSGLFGEPGERLARVVVVCRQSKPVEAGWGTWQYRKRCIHAGYGLGPGNERLLSVVGMFVRTGLFGEPGKAAPIYAKMGFADLAAAATWTLKVPIYSRRLIHDISDLS